MNELIESKIEELYSLLTDKPNQVLSIFNDFFGEDKVDMQGLPSIDEFKFWINTTPINIYTVEDLLDIDSEEYCLHEDKTLPNLKGNILNVILSQLCAIHVVDIIGREIFSSGFILVHFPHVRITNEYDRFVDINHLYAKVNILYNGSIDGFFSLNRAEYTYLHISNNYMHSHVREIPRNDFTVFQIPCTGTGPINDTINSLNKDFDSDLWRLFCLELSKYVEVESISGVPYHRLENLGALSTDAIAGTFRAINNLVYSGEDMLHLVKDFIPYFIKQGKLKFNYANVSYSIGMSFIEYIIVISNEFIKWYNGKFNNKEITYSFRNLKDKGVLQEVIIANNKIYKENSNNNNIDTYKAYIGKKMCTFKGKDILINIIDLNNVEKENNKSIILNPSIALYILTKILKVINYRYGRTEQRDQEGNRISEKVRYF